MLILPLAVIGCRDMEQAVQAPDEIHQYDTAELKFLSQKTYSAITPWFNPFTDYRNHPGVIGWNFLIALFETGLQLAIMCGVALALDLDIPLPLLASIIAVTEFVRRVAIVLDGWGLATALQIFMYGLVGISGAQALLIALLSHAVHFIASLPGGVLMLTDRWGER